MNRSQSGPLSSSTSNNLTSQSINSISPMVHQDDSLDKILSRVNFYESSVDQLKKELPKYLQQHADIEKAHSSLSKVLRAVGSSEPHSLMQYLLFSYAQREEELAGYQSNYRNLTIDQKQSLESWSKKLIQPMREIIDDYLKTMKINPKTDPGANTSTSTPPTLPPQAPSSSSINGPISSASTVQKSVLEASGAFQTFLPVTDQDRQDLLQSSLAVHMKLFEKHRIQELKQMLRQMILNEVTYHAKALESYSALLECLMEIEDFDK